MYKREMKEIIKKHFSVLTLPNSNNAEKELDILVEALHKKMHKSYQKDIDNAYLRGCAELESKIQENK